MKRILLFLSLFCVTASVFAISNDLFNDGVANVLLTDVETTNTEVNVKSNEKLQLTIDSKQELINFRDAINGTADGDGDGIPDNIYKGVPLEEGGAGKIFLLTIDVDLNEGYVLNSDGTVTYGDQVYDENNLPEDFEIWVPIAWDSDPFNGDFQGNNHTVSGVYINNEVYNYQGFFSRVDRNGFVNNLCIINSYVKGNSVVGGIAGEVHVGQIKYSYNSGTVVGIDQVGGIVGSMPGALITNCYNVGTVIGNSVIGGIGGQLYYGVIENSYNTGLVIGGGYDVGGVAGLLIYDGAVNNCYNVGEVRCNEYEGGGVVGTYEYGAGRVNNCYYDKQMCPIELAEGATGVVPLLTSEMIGTALQGSNKLGDEDTWVFTEGMYPRLEDMATAPEAIANAAPIYLQLIQDEEGNVIDYETVIFVVNNFALGNNESDDVVWSSSNTDVLLIDSENDSAIVSSVEEVVLSASVNGVVCKQIVINKSLYPIYSEDDLIAFGKAVNGDVEGDNNFLYIYNGGERSVDLSDCGVGKTFCLMNDIDLNPGYVFNSDGTYTGGETPQIWTPIGYRVAYNPRPFKGTFDGCNHTISGVYIDSEENNQGLFSRVIEGTIEKVEIINSYIKGGNNVGSVVGDIENGIISDCCSQGTIVGNDRVGGIVGQLSGSTLANSYNCGTIEGETQLGGLVGSTYYGTVTNNYNVGNVRGNDDVGGIIGLVLGGTITDNYNVGTIAGNSQVGGIVGLLDYDATMTSCYNIGAVKAMTEESTNLGGIVGIVQTGIVNNCYYDKQMCPMELAAGIWGIEPLLTNEMLGTALQDSLGIDNWIFEEGKYPLLNSVPNSDAAIVSVAPILLNASKDGSIYENVVDGAYCRFYVSIDNDVVWTSNSNDTISITDSIAIINYICETPQIVSASRNGLVYKQIELNVATESFASEFEAIACDEYTWNDVTYTESGTYVQELETFRGCDSIVTLYLTIKHSVISEFDAVACDEYTWNETTYTESGDYEQVFEAVNGCDSIVTLHLTINNSVTNEFDAVACDEYTWNDTTYTESGEYVQEFETIHGCDSIVTLHLTINNSVISEFDAIACDEYTWNEETYTESGEYVQEFETIHGCDSIVTLHLTINNSVISEFDAVACDEYTWNEVTYTESGDYEQVFEAVNGCDSIVTLHLTINNTIMIEFDAIACDEYTWNDVTYTESGEYVQEFETIHGCDSIVTLHLTINNSVISEFDAVACDEYTWNDVTYTESGEYVQEFETIHGCDSIVTLHLTINNSVTNEFDVVACDEYTWNDVTYTESGEYVQEFETIHGCDSIVTLYLTINNSVTNEFDAVACDEYTWNDVTYTESGEYVQEFETIHGCDSIVTLYLTILNCTQEIAVGNSWSWISSYKNSEMTISDIFENSGLPWSVESGISLLQSPDNADLLAIPGTENDFQWDYKHGYKVFSNNEDDIMLVVEGLPLTAEEMQLTFYMGWSMIPVLVDSPINASAMMELLPEGIVIAGDSGETTIRVNDENGDYIIGDFALQPGKGYYLCTDETCTFDYNDLSNLKTTVEYAPSTLDDNSPMTTDSMQIVYATNEALTSFEIGDYLIAVNVEGVVVGAQQYTGNGIAMQVYGADQEHGIPGYLSGDEMKFELYRPSTDETFNIEYATSSDEMRYFEPFNITRIETITFVEGVEDVVSTSISIYPNPTRGISRITGEAIERIQVLNSVGAVLHDYTMPTAVSYYDIDMSNYGKGTYIIYITTKHGTTSHKLVKM